MKIEGTVVPGLGEGKYYLLQKKYNKQFKKKLGYEPFPGTLNIELNEKELGKMKLLKEMEGINIEGFETNERTFGKARCFKGNIEGKEIAVILPERSHHPNVIEIISPINLRKELGLKDGERISIWIE